VQCWSPPAQRRRCTLRRDLGTGKMMLRNYIKAIMGFERRGAATGASPKSLIRMFDPRGPRPPRASA